MNRRLLGAILFAVQALAAGAVATAQDGAARAGSPLGAAAKRLVSLDIQGANARELSSQLSALAGIRVVYAPAQGSEEINLQVQDFPLGALISQLARQGGVAIAGQDFVPAPGTGFDKKVLRQKVTINAHGMDAGGVSDLLSGLLGTPVEWNVRDAGMKLNFEFKDVAVQDVLQQLGKLGDLSVQGLTL